MAKTTLDNIKHGIAQQKGFPDVQELIQQWSRDGKYDWIDIFYTEVAKIHANSKLEEAAECANLQREWKNTVTGKVEETEIVDGCSLGNFRYTVNKKSILNLREEV